MKTTVVIPNYNGKHFLQDCLDSLLQSTVEFAVIVVDNGSTDGSVSWIQEHFPQVKLICFSENKGFVRQSIPELKLLLHRMFFF